MNDERLDQFLSSIDREWTWRQKELSDLKQLLAFAEGYQKNVIARSGLLLLYANWEGFIKQISKTFLEKFCCEDISRVPKYVIAAHLAQIQRSLNQKNYDIDAADQCLLKLSNTKICACVHEVINTGSNLNAKNLKKIARSVGVDFKPFELRSKFIDHELINERNGIAHGEGRKITENQFLELEKSVTLMMNVFKEDIKNSATEANQFLNGNEKHTWLKLKD